MVDAPRAARHGRAAWLLVPAALVAGTATTFLLARTAAEPYRGVYRQEAVAAIASRAGRVLTIEAANAVAPGDPLATIEDLEAVTRRDRLRDEKARLLRSLDEATARAGVELARDREPLERERLETRLRYADLLQSKLDVELRQRVLKGLDADGPVLRPVSTGGDDLPRRLDLAEAVNRLDVLSTQAALCEDRLAELDRRLAELPAAVDRAAGVERLRVELAEVETGLAEAEAAEPSLRIVSPAHGRSGVPRRAVGEAIAAGETLVEVFDAERPYVLLTVPVGDLPEFAVGRTFRIAFPRAETRKPFFGVVAATASEAETDSASASAPNASAVRVRLEPTGRLWPVLAPGTTVEVPPQSL